MEKYVIVKREKEMAMSRQSQSSSISNCVVMSNSTGGKGGEEAGMNRDYLAQRMTDELNEIIRVLQLTTYDEDEWDADNLTGMKRALQVIDSKLTAAHDWLRVRELERKLRKII
jgi:hypothetical protein